MIHLFDKKARLASRLAQITIVACDLDGTLLNNANEVSRATLDTITELRGLGTELVLASGRSLHFTDHYASIIGTDMPVIALNGGLISEFEESATDYVHGIPEGIIDTIEEIENTLKETPFEVTLFTPEGLFATSENAVLPKYLRIDDEPCTYVQDLREREQDAGLAVVYATYPGIQQLSVRIAQKFGRIVQRVQYASKSQTDMCYLEISNARANKGTALAYICKQMNIPKREVAAIGDFANDLEMLRFASVSAVMANAIDELHGVADYITERDNNEGGVAEFLETILHQKRNR